MNLSDLEESRKQENEGNPNCVLPNSEVAYGKKIPQ